jgi:hypothetical protein
MPGFSRASIAGTSVLGAAPGDRDAEVYDRHAPWLYRQALLTLDDPERAEQVVSDVIVDECVRPPAPAAHDDTASHRLAVAAYRRCEELARDQAWHDHAPRPRRPGSLASCIGLSGFSGKERGALGLVIFGGLGHVQAGRELAIPPQQVAALLWAVRAVLATRRAPSRGAAPGA